MVKIFLTVFQNLFLAETSDFTKKVDNWFLSNLVFSFASKDIFLCFSKELNNISAEIFSSKDEIYLYYCLIVFSCLTV